jgi:hypothetical protein
MPSAAHRGPLCGASNCHPIDTGTTVRTRTFSPVERFETVRSLPLTDRLARALRYAAERLPGEMGRALRSLIEPKSLALMAGFFGLSAAAQLTPYGWVADFIAFAVGVATLGPAALQAAAELRAFSSAIVSAAKEEDLRRAGEHLARALLLIGVGALLLWLTRRAPKAGTGAAGAQAVMAAARSVPLNAGRLEVALWSDEAVLQFIPKRFATLERMLEATPQGKELLARIDSKSAPGGWEAVKEYWWELSDRAAQVAEDSGRDVHYYVSRNRGFWDATHPPAEAELRAWWARENPPASRSKTWTTDELEELYYAKNRRGARPDARGRFHYEDEVFHKIEKLNIRKVIVHEIDPATGAEKTWVQDL